MNLILLLALLGFQPTVAEASVISPVTVEWSTTTAPLIVNAYAYRYGVSYEEMWATLLCENKNLDPLLQSYVPKADGPNGRENSWGVAQWNLDHNTTITKAQAQDPFWSVEQMAIAFKDGQQTKWTCWRKNFGGKSV